MELHTSLFFPTQSPYFIKVSGNQGSETIKWLSSCHTVHFWQSQPWNPGLKLTPHSDISIEHCLFKYKVSGYFLCISCYQTLWVLYSWAKDIFYSSVITWAEQKFGLSFSFYMYTSPPPTGFALRPVKITRAILRVGSKLLGVWAFHRDDLRLLLSPIPPCPQMSICTLKYKHKKKEVSSSGKLQWLGSQEANFNSQLWVLESRL